LRLLIVEDHADTATMLKKLLERSGHTVQTAGDVASALKLAARETFDLLISDVGLPDASGYALMREVAARYNLRGVAMSGYGMDEDVRKSMEAGFSAHLVKPVDITALEQTIQRLAFGK
jgi:Response regulator containing CheY-like receiver, AAA-type ATPase, and DNA-binding domains